jgi:hypothetical protein
MDNEIRTIRLFTPAGEKLLHETRMTMPADGEHPRMIEWDDGPDGPRTFLHHEGDDYREQHAYVLSLVRAPLRPVARHG